MKKLVIVAVLTALGACAPRVVEQRTVLVDTVSGQIVAYGPGWRECRLDGWNDGQRCSEAKDVQ